MDSSRSKRSERSTGSGQRSMRRLLLIAIPPSAVALAVLVATAFIQPTGRHYKRDETPVLERVMFIAFWNLGEFYEQQGMCVEAKEVWMDVVRFNGFDVRPYARAAQAYYCLGDIERAEAMLKHARATAPREANVATLLGGVLMTRGDLKGAREQLEAARKLAVRKEETEWARGSLEVLEEAEARR
jgi:Flp pilus assembly protein TadD